MEERSGIRAHACRLENRNAASLTGVREVVSFDENQVVMDTDMGLLTIKGKDLHVSRLTVEKGEMEVEGQIDSLTYSSNEAYRKAGQSILPGSLADGCGMPGGAASASEHFSGRGSYDGVRSHPAVPVSGASQESGGRTGGFLLLDLGRLFHLFVSVP